MASNKGAASNSSQGNNISITVPNNVTSGLLICTSTGWMHGPSQNTPYGSGIKSIVETKYDQLAYAACSGLTKIYECDFNAGGTINFTFTNSGSTGYATGQIVLLA